MHNPYAAPRAGLELRFAPASEARLLSWNGRLGRVRFLAYSLLGIPLAILLGLLSGIAAGITDPGADYAGKASLLVMGVVFITTPMLVLAAAARRRLHDFDVSGWWTLFLLLPIFQFIFLIYLLVAPGTPAANRFGALPPAPDFGVKLGAALGSALLFGFIALRFL